MPDSENDSTRSPLEPPAKLASPFLDSTLTLASAREVTPQSLNVENGDTKKDSGNTKPKPRIRIHPIHNDPNDDMVLISNDLVQFRASIYHLTRVSSFFEGMLTTARPREDDEKLDIEPIHVDFPFSTIAIFLDIACSSSPCVPELSIEAAKSLLKLTEFTMSDSLVDPARFALMEACSKVPLELLVIASDRDDVEMARHALRKPSGLPKETVAIFQS